MIHALARTAGFDEEEAKLLADGSWSADQNKSTLAVRGHEDVVNLFHFRVRATLDKKYAQSLLTERKAIDDVISNNGLLARVGSAAVIHSLTPDPRSHAPDPNKPSLDRAFHQYIDEQISELRQIGVAPDKLRKVRLILYGQHLHQVVDSFVHPHDSLIGHAAEGHGTDYAFNHRDEFAQAAFKALRIMETIPSDRRVTDLKTLGLETTEKQLGFCRDLVNEIAKGYVPSFDPQHPEKSRSILMDWDPTLRDRRRDAIRENVEALVNQQFDNAGVAQRYEVAKFDNVEFTAGGKRFHIRYEADPEVKVYIDNVVHWVAEHPELQELADAIRESVREQIRNWQLHGMSDVNIVKDEKVGGVFIKFEPGALEGDANDEDIDRLVRKVEEFVSSPESGGLLLRAKFGGETLEFVSLRELAVSNSKTLGQLTRVRGYIVKQDDIILVGKAEAGRPKIDAELLTVALNSIYRSGSWPFVSIDPDPYNPFGDQTTRVGGVPDQYVQSEFVRIMLDADYDMKRINLGELRLDIPGFLSSYDILQEIDGPIVPEMRRFWLAPLIAASGDVMENRSAVVFESGVQVLTERMKQAGEFIVSSRENDRHGERAADYMTLYYSQIEQQVDSFYELHGLFDVAKLCAILRFKNIEHPVLDTIAERPVRTVKRRDGKGILEPYEGIGPKVVPGTIIMIGGGASSRQRLRATAFVHSDAVGQLLEGKRTLRLESSVPLPRGAHPELLLGTAIRELGAGHADACISNCTQALEIDPDFAEARVFRALGLLEAGHAHSIVIGVVRCHDIDFEFHRTKWNRIEDNDHPDLPVRAVRRFLTPEDFVGRISLLVHDRPGPQHSLDAGTR